MSTTRRTLLAGLAAAALPTLALPAGIEADPTFALIEHHRAAYTAFNDALRASELGDAPVEDKAESDAMEALLTPEPTTLAGLRALALYMAAYDKRTDDFETAQWALATLAAACRALIPAPIGGDA